ncbi:MAG: response regulator, partial [Candidatus Nealsonbacteria bacterium CG02_land_8_20_14_3_00_40_11]
DRAQKLGAKDWLIKTEFNPQEVIEKVKKQIG